MSDKALFDAVRAIAGRGLTQAEVDRIKAALATVMPTEPVAQLPANPAIDPNDALLIKELERDEGRVKHAYQDSLGYWTIGIGRLIDKRRGGGLSDAEIDYLKANDISRIKGELDQRLPWWRRLDPVRQRVIQNLAFNLGTPGLIEKWPNTVALIQRGDYAGAARAMRGNGVWLRQVKDRGRRLATMMETGRAA